MSLNPGDRVTDQWGHPGEVLEATPDGKVVVRLSFGRIGVQHVFGKQSDFSKANDNPNAAGGAA